MFMNKKRNLLLILLAFVMVTVLCVPTCTHAAGGSYKFSVSKSDNTYGYKYFGKMKKGGKLQAMYKELDKAAKSFHNKASKNAKSDNVLIELDYTKYGLSLDDAISVWQMYKFDHPLYYWISNTVDLSGGGIEVKVIPAYRNGKKRVAMNKKITKKLQGYLDLVKGETDPYAIAAILQREICLSAEYKVDKYGVPSDEEYCHNIIGILNNKGTVCEGYAKLFSLLLNECGVTNVIAAGNAGGQKHAWNMVKMSNGRWYYCDLTWDDKSMMLSATGSYDCFMKGSKSFKDHKAYSYKNTGVEFLYKLPRAASGNYKPKVKFGKEFRVGQDSYIVSGYKEATLYSTKRTGNVIIPETVNYNGVTYKVVALGKDQYFDTLVSGEVKSVKIPKTVRMIWDNALFSGGLESITVDAKNKYYRSKDGILYTKSFYTLVQYPSAKKMDKLVLPSNTHYIAHGAIDTDSAGAIGQLVVNAKLENVGITNWGVGPIDKKVAFANVVNGEWGRIAYSCQNITISTSNEYYYTKNGLILQNGSLYFVNNKGIKGVNVLAPTSCNVKTVTLPSNAVGIYNSAFYKLPYLETVNFNTGLKYIDYSAFYNNPYITKLILPEGLLYIEQSAFSCNFSDSNTTYEIYIPKSVKKLEGSLGNGHIIVHGVNNSLAQKHAKEFGHEFTTEPLR